MSVGIISTGFVVGWIVMPILFEYLTSRSGLRPRQLLAVVAFTLLACSGIAIISYVHEGNRGVTKTLAAFAVGAACWLFVRRFVQEISKNGRPIRRN